MRKSLFLVTLLFPLFAQADWYCPYYPDQRDCEQLPDAGPGCTADEAAARIWSRYYPGRGSQQREGEYVRLVADDGGTFLFATRICTGIDRSVTEWECHGRWEKRLFQVKRKTCEMEKMDRP